jgi:hypothetical protein
VLFSGDLPDLRLLAWPVGEQPERLATLDHSVDR